MPGTTSTALPSFSHDQHHETDAAKWKGGPSQQWQSIEGTPVLSAVTDKPTHKAIWLNARLVSQLITASSV